MCACVCSLFSKRICASALMRDCLWQRLIQAFAPSPHRYCSCHPKCDGYVQMWVPCSTVPLELSYTWVMSTNQCETGPRLLEFWSWEDLAWQFCLDSSDWSRVKTDLLMAGSTYGMVGKNHGLGCGPKRLPMAEINSSIHPLPCCCCSWIYEVMIVRRDQKCSELVRSRGHKGKCMLVTMEPLSSSEPQYHEEHS